MKFVSLALFLIGAVIYVGLCLAGFLSLRKKQLSPLNGFAFEAMPKSENRKTFLYFLFGLATVCLGLSPLAMVGYFLNSGIASNATLLMFGMLMFIGSGALMYLPLVTGADKPKKHIYGFVLAICLLATSSLVYGLNFMGNELAHWREWDETKENDWFLLSYPAHDAFHQYFSKLGEFYMKEKTLYENDYSWESFEWIDADNADKNLFSYIRKGKDKDFVVILNFSPNHYSHEVFGVLTKGTYTEVLNTEWNRYGGSVDAPAQKCHAARVSRNNKPYMIEVDVPAFGGILLEVVK